jgi:hypothetical protein
MVWLCRPVRPSARVRRYTCERLSNQAAILELPFACSRSDHAAVCATRTGKVVVVVVSPIAEHPVEAERILGDTEARCGCAILRRS